MQSTVESISKMGLVFAVVHALNGCGGSKEASTESVDSVTVPVADPVADSSTSTSEQIPTDGSLNILLIVGDDIGVDVISGYGEQPNYSAQTSTLDELAEEGIMFRNAWANPMCSPSRAGLLTGRYAIRHGVTYPGGETGRLSSNEETLPAVLKRADYVTSLFGKWHLGNEIGSYPTEHGFDYYSGAIGNLDDYFNWDKIQINGNAGEFNLVEETGYATEVVSNEAASWISSQLRPWFAQVSFNAPHSPLQVPPSSTYRSVNLFGDIGDYCTSSPLNDVVASCYRASAESMDFYIDKLLSSLDEDVLANTVVIFVGDNGTPSNAVIEEAGLPFVKGHGKRTVYEGGVNVPLIIWGGSNTGVDYAEVQEKVIIQDIFSTIVTIANGTFTTDNVIDGLSLVDYLDNETEKTNEHNVQYSELKSESEGIDRWAITNGDAKYLNNEGVEECYSLLSDPAESSNAYLTGEAISNICDDLKTERPTEN